MLSAQPRLVRDAFERSRYRWLKRKERDASSLCPGTVSFTFDDFPVTAAHQGAALLEDRGWRGTFYLCAGLLATRTEVGQICSLEDVQALHRAGHEIGDHTFSHLDCVTAGRAALAVDVASSLRMLEGFGERRNFAFPFGLYDTAALNFLSGCYDTMRTIRPGVNRGLIDLNMLKANAVYESADFGPLAGLIDLVRREGGWLIFYTHDVAALPSRFGCTADRLQKLFDLVARTDLHVATVADACRRLSGDARSGWMTDSAEIGGL